MITHPNAGVIDGIMGSRKEKLNILPDNRILPADVAEVVLANANGGLTIRRGDLESEAGLKSWPLASHIGPVWNKATVRRNLRTSHSS